MSTAEIPTERADATAAKLGRPRDLQAEQRILEAALRIYGERGWYGINMQGVANAARVSKGLLYSRWTAVEEILTAAFESLNPDEIRADAIEDVLRAECHRLADLFLGPHGPALMRLWVEGSVGPDFLRTLLADVNLEQAALLRARVLRAVREGELPESCSPTRLMDVIEGAMFAHIFMTPPTKRPRMRSKVDIYINALVHEQLCVARQCAVE